MFWMILYGAVLRDRTADLLLTMETLCRLSYRGRTALQATTREGSGPNRRPHREQPCGRGRRRPGKHKGPDVLRAPVGGRCRVRTYVGDADGFTDRSLWPLGQPAGALPRAWAQRRRATPQRIQRLPGTDANPLLTLGCRAWQIHRSTWSARSTGRKSTTLSTRPPKKCRSGTTSAAPTPRSPGRATR